MSSPGHHSSTGPQPGLSVRDESPTLNTGGFQGEDEENDDTSTPPTTDAAPDLPMSMTASVILSSLPQDAASALATTTETIDAYKVAVRFQPIGSAPMLKQRVFKINASSKFGAVVAFLRKKLGVREGDSLFLYINNVFAPGLDEGVGNLHRCFKVDDQLIVAYSTTPAFG